MKLLIISLSAVLIAACGLGPEGRSTATTTEVPTSVGHNQRPEDQPVPSVSSLGSKKFIREFEKKYAGAKSLPVDQLFQMIEMVPPQTEEIPWNCGLVQSNMAKASAAIALGRSIDREDVANCLDVGDYPLLVNATLLPQGVSVFRKLGANLQKIGNSYYFRVGAVGDEIAEFINKPPKRIIAVSKKPEELSRKGLIELIDQSIAKKMPLITINVKNAEAFILHYYGIVGYLDGGERLLVLDTTKNGIERLKTFDTANFLAEMDTSQFRNNILAFYKQLGPLLPLLNVFVTSDSKLPSEADLDSLGRFNMVVFE